MKNNIYDNRMRIYASEKDNPDWDQKDKSHPTFIKNKPKFSNKYFILEDEAGIEYTFAIQDGNLTSVCMAKEIKVITMPNITSYFTIDGNIDFDPTGMIIGVVRQDESIDIIENYSIDTSKLLKDNNVYIEYKEYDKIYTTSIEIECSSLIDFDYIAEDDGTYTLTAWKKTRHGEPSTECILPNSELVNL